MVTGHDHRVGCARTDHCYCWLGTWDHRARFAHRTTGDPDRADARGEVITTVIAITTSLAGLIVGRDDEDGQGLAEYALILALIAIVAIVALIFLGGQVSQILSKVGKSI